MERVGQFVFLFIWLLAIPDWSGGSQVAASVLQTDLGKTYSPAVIQTEEANCLLRIEAGKTLFEQEFRLLEAEEQFQTALDCYQAQADQSGQAKALSEIGLVYLAQGRYQEALTAVEQALTTYEELDDQGGQAEALDYLGRLYQAQGNYIQARRAFEQAATMQKQLGNQVGLAAILVDTASMYLAQGLYPEALTMGQEALTIWQELNQPLEIGRTLTGIGSIYQIQGQWDEALQTYQQAAAIARTTEDHSTLSTILSAIADIYQQQARYSEALDNYQEALGLVKITGFRIKEAAIYNQMGTAYQNQGRLPEALTHFQQALTLVRELREQGPEGIILNNVGTIYQLQGLYSEALVSFQQALPIHQRVGDRVQEAVTLSNIGLTFRHQSQYTKALDNYQQALQLQREIIGDRRGAAVTLTNIGAVYESLSQYGEALSNYQQALALMREIGSSSGESTVLSNIANIYAYQGRRNEAVETYKQALDLAQQTNAGETEAGILHSLGLMYEKQGRYREALNNLEQALALIRQMDNRAKEAQILIGLGVVHHSLGNYATIDYYEEALAILRELGNRDDEGVALNNLGRVYQDWGREDEALQAYQQALSLRREVGDRGGEGITLENIGALQENTGHYQEALATYQQALDIYEQVRATAGSEEGRTSFIAQHADLYSRLIGLLHQQGQTKQAFFTSERSRARAFLDSLVTGEVQLNDNELTGLLTRERTTNERYQTLQTELTRIRTLNPANSTLITNLETQLAAAEQAHQEALAAIAARSDQLAALTPGRSSQTLLDVAGVQQRLEAGTALLSFYSLEKQTLAFLITPDHFEVVELPVSREQLTNQVSRLRDLLAFKQPEATQTAAQELYQALIPNLQSRLPTLPSRLLIVPHGPLHYLPFAALYDSTQAKYLVEQYELVMLPGASVLPFITADRQPHSTDLTALVVGNPTPGDLTADLLAGADPVELPPLPYARKEAEAIAALYNIEPLFGADATESAVRRQAEQAGIVHLAAHGYYNPAAPLNSLIALAPDSHQSPISNPQSPVTQDGWLTVGEVYGLNLKQADLVVLSACQTQLGELSAGDELVGLTRAFIFAGTPSVMASLWNVDDAATAHLMEKFYIHLRAGMSKASALRQAQLDTLADFPDPYYWAAFTLSGDGGPVSQTATPQIIQPDAEPQPNWPWLAAGIGVLVLVTIGGLLWRRYRV